MPQNVAEPWNARRRLRPAEASTRFRGTIGFPPREILQVTSLLLHRSTSICCDCVWKAEENEGKNKGGIYLHYVLATAEKNG